MTCENEIHIGDIGTSFEMILKECDSIVDLTGAVTKEIIFRKPDKSIVTKTAEFKTNGTDGVIQYITILGDLDQKNSWSIQARVELPTGIWSSDISKFKVHANL